MLSSLFYIGLIYVMDGRSWMYRDLPQSLWMMDYYNNIQGFINYAQSNPINISEEDLRCSCNRCKNKKFLGPDVVTMHLLYIKKKVHEEIYVLVWTRRTICVFTILW